MNLSFVVGDLAFEVGDLASGRFASDSLGEHAMLEVAESQPFQNHS